jgi:hypothetical protein
MNKHTYLIIFLSLTTLLAGIEKEEWDEFISLDGKVSVKRDSDDWLKITVPFKIEDKHPDWINGFTIGQASNLEDLYRVEDKIKFLDNLEIHLIICFRNKLAVQHLNRDKDDKRNFQYYSASVKCMLLEIGKKYKAHFLFPLAIAKRDGFGGSYPDVVGYIVDFIRNGEEFKVEKSRRFTTTKYLFELKKGSTEKHIKVLEDFKAEAQNYSPENEGILIPAHKIDRDYLVELGPVYLD